MNWWRERCKRERDEREIMERETESGGDGEGTLLPKAHCGYGGFVRPTLSIGASPRLKQQANTHGYLCPSPAPAFLYPLFRHLTHTLDVICHIQAPRYHIRHSQAHICHVQAYIHNKQAQMRHSQAHICHVSAHTEKKNRLTCVIIQACMYYIMVHSLHIEDLNITYKT